MVVTTEWGTFSAELSPSEAIMWKGEDQPSLRSGGPLLLMLDRSPEWSRLLSSFERFSSLFPRYRQRIVTPPFNLGRPRWVVDPDFDLAFHLRRVALPPPGDFYQLLKLIEPDASAAFDPARPPWLGLLVEGLSDGRTALVLRSHHTLFDGRGMMQVFERCFDRERQPAALTPVAIPVPEQITEIDLLRSALHPRTVMSGARRVSRGVVCAAWSTLKPAPLAANVVHVRRSLAQLIRPSARPGSPLLSDRSNSVRFGTVDVPLADLKAAGKSVGASVNDALLAIVAGALGRYHEVLGKPVQSVNLAFPISIRTDDDALGGNRFGGATISAPTVADTTSRITEIREQVLRARDALGPDIIGPLSAVFYQFPSWVIASLPLMANIDAQVSNIPGLPYRHYIAGAEVVRAYAFGPHPGTPMMIVLISHAGTCCLGVNADAAAISDMPLFMTSLSAAVNDVVALGTTGQGTKPGPTGPVRTSASHA
jgi:diacylglycerol O-acyltransferase / wax synthase